MKNIKRIVSIVLLTLFLVACDEENNFKEPNIGLVPIYSLTEISNNGPFKISVYREKALIVEYSSVVNASNFVSSGYSDASTDTTYDVSVIKIVDILDDEGIKTGEESITYAVNGDKETGTGTLTVDSGTVHDITISEEEVYN